MRIQSFFRGFKLRKFNKLLSAMGGSKFPLTRDGIAQAAGVYGFRVIKVRATAPVIQCGTRVLVPLLDSLMFGRVLK